MTSQTYTYAHIHACSHTHTCTHAGTHAGTHAQRHTDAQTPPHTHTHKITFVTYILLRLLKRLYYTLCYLQMYVFFFIFLKHIIRVNESVLNVIFTIPSLSDIIQDGSVIDEGQRCLPEAGYGHALVSSIVYFKKDLVSNWFRYKFQCHRLIFHTCFIISDRCCFL